MNHDNLNVLNNENSTLLQLPSTLNSHIKGDQCNDVFKNTLNNNDNSTECELVYDTEARKTFKIADDLSYMNLPSDLNKNELVVSIQFKMLQYKNTKIYVPSVTITFIYY